MGLVTYKSHKLLSLLVSARFLFSTSFRIQNRGISMASFDTQNQMGRFGTLQVGLTGSIGMGKSTLSKQLMTLGVPLFDADLEVHKLYGLHGGAVDPIMQVFPDVVTNGCVDRSKLTVKIMQDPSVLKRVESIVHPLVASERQRFYEQACAERRFMVVYDIPLLFENLDKYDLDYTIVATAAAHVQRMRVLDRPGMTEEKFAAILAKQVPDAVKREKADFIVQTDFAGFAEAKGQLANILQNIVDRNPQLWEQWKHGRVTRSRDVQDVAATPSQSASLTPAAARVREAIDLVLFDLDDTLVPVMTQLGQATAAMKAFMTTHMPQTCAVVDANLRSTMKNMATKHPLLAHDLNEVRRAALAELAAPYPEEQAFINQATDIFFQVRSDVSGNFYSDSAACLEWLVSLGIKVGVLTNGSADLSRCAYLKNILTLTFTAGEVGTSKPSPIGFMACAQVTGIPPNRILYVGDSYECDVLGSNNAGMVSALLLRKDYNQLEVRSDADVFSAEEIAQQQRDKFPAAKVVLPSLRVSDLEAVLGRYFSSAGSGDNGSP